MSDLLRVSEILPGVHRVRARLAQGRVREYWYAWRGGPPILTATAQGDAALDRELARLLPQASAKYQEERRPGGDQVSFHGLVTRYLAVLAADDALSDRTKADRRKYLDVARTDLGKMEIRAFESRKARGFLIRWRDTYEATPKTADERLGAVSQVLQWAADRGELAANPVKDFPRIYRVNRAEVIWTPAHFDTALPRADAAFALALEGAALTGLRKGDLCKIPKTSVGADAIVWQTGKSRGRKTIVIPIYPALRKWLGRLPTATDATTLLVNSQGRPWTEAGLAAALRRMRLAATAYARKRGGPKAASGLDGLRWHDLRGTAATNFILGGLQMDDVARILGWETGRVEEIAVRYVTAEALGRAMVQRLHQNTPKTKAVKGPVKDH